MNSLKLAVQLKKIKKAVGKPYFESKNVLLYNMDCFDFMDKLEQPFIDLTITSPPYNIGKEYEKKKSISNYLDWSELWMRKVHRITKRRGAFWLNLGYFKVPQKGKAIPIGYLLWDKTPFYFLQEIVWHYGAGISTSRMFSPRNEKYLWFVKNPKSYVFHLNSVRDKEVKYPYQKKNGKLKCNPNGKNPTNVWSIPKVTSGNGRSSKDRTPHPTQSPVLVIDRIVKACSNKGGLVFDPFIGSGTVALTSLMNNRVVVGCEVKTKYIQIARKRIEKWKNSCE